MSSARPCSTSFEPRHGTPYTTEREVRQVVQAAFISAGADKPAALVKAVTEALAVRDQDAPNITDRAGNPNPDPELRDYENVPLPEASVAFESDPAVRLDTIEYRTAVEDYMAQEVSRYVPDAWDDPTKTKVGYEIPLSRHFYTYTPPRSIDEINDQIRTIEAEIQVLIGEVTECGT